MESSLPTPFGRYELLCHLATGGMAELYLAHLHGLPGFEKTLAVKLILESYSSHPEFVQRFVQEARLAAMLDHPNIVQVHDAGVVDGRYFLAMEYVHGVDLRHILAAADARDRRLSLEESLTLILGVCAGAHHAHERRGADGALLGIVHRDISPSNVLVGLSGSVKLADFGIAFAADQASLNRPGVIYGKIRYLSPEQCRGHAVDRRSDVFSLGILLYELTTGANAYPGAGSVEVFQRLLSGPPPAPSSLVADYAPQLERIVMRCLQVSPADRYPTAEAVQRDLEAFAGSRGLVLSPTRITGLLEELFGAQLQSWRVAEQQGKRLADHLVATVSMARARGTELWPAQTDTVPSAPELSGTARQRPPPDAQAPKPRQRRAATLAGLGLLVLLGAAFAISGIARSGAGAASSPAGPAPAAQPEAPAVAEPARPIDPVRAVAKAPPSGKLVPHQLKTRPARSAPSAREPATKQPLPARPSEWNPDSPLPPTP